MIRVNPIMVSRDELPEIALSAVGPGTPPERRLLLARAAIPMDPSDLIVVLAYLIGDESNVVSKAALESLESLPWGVLSGALSKTTSTGVFDTLARTIPGREGLFSDIVKNRATDDQTIAWIASSASGPILDEIAANHIRIQRFPDIVEAIYYNAETRMGTVSSVLEAAVRLKVDLSHIPGYQEIVESIFGAGVVDGGDSQKDEPQVVETTAEVATDSSALAPDLAGRDDWLLAEICADDTAMSESEEFLSGEGSGEIAEDDFLNLLSEAVRAQEKAASEGEDPEKVRMSIWQKVAAMSVPQKVRMALLGSATVRGLLIRDTRRIVYLSVLKSPRLSDKDIADFARNKALNEEIIRTIAGTREWTKLYQVRLGLVMNPKTPPSASMNFLRTLTEKDLKNVAKSHEVPAFVARQAKSMVSAREAKH